MIATIPSKLNGLTVRDAICMSDPRVIALTYATLFDELDANQCGNAVRHVGLVSALRYVRRVEDAIRKLVEQIESMPLHDSELGFTAFRASDKSSHSVLSDFPIHADFFVTGDVNGRDVAERLGEFVSCWRTGEDGELPAWDGEHGKPPFEFVSLFLSPVEDVLSARIVQPEVDVTDAEIVALLVRELTSFGLDLEKADERKEQLLTELDRQYEDAACFEVNPDNEAQRKLLDFDAAYERFGLERPSEEEREESHRRTMEALRDEYRLMMEHCVKLRDLLSDEDTDR